MKLNVVLYAPEIPANTGTIGRSCVLTDSALHLIEPLGFSLDDKMVRRSGLGYWHDIDLHTYASWDEFLEKNPHASLWLCSAKASSNYAQVEYKDGDYLVFGSESVGLPEELLERYPDRCLRIPMLNRQGISAATQHGPLSDPADPAAVSLNLSNAANIVLFEALRQLGFEGLEQDGTSL